MAHHSIVDLARRNGSGPGHREVFEKILERSRIGTHTGAHMDANRLLEWMASAPWEVGFGAVIHTGGKGDKKHGPDFTRHYMLRIQGRDGFHLRVDKNGHIFQITGNGSTGIPPYIAPGVPLPKERHE